VGHLFQGRYKAILVQKEAYLLELSRYIVLNPLRAKMVDALEAWPWSSYQYYMGDVAVPAWLECDWLLGRFGTLRSRAITAYRDSVLAGIGKASPLSETRHQVLLGDDDFIAQHQQLQRSETLAETVRIERAAVALSLTEYRRRVPDRAEVMARAYLSTAFTMPNIAHAFDVSVQTVSRAVKIWEGRIVRR
jgi:putative transposase